MSITDTVSISVEAKSNTVQSEINITCVDNTMKLNLEEKVTQQFPIKVVTTGSTKKRICGKWNEFYAEYRKG